jgi:hypothetical protein
MNKSCFQALISVLIGASALSMLSSCNEIPAIDQGQFSGTVSGLPVQVAVAADSACEQIQNACGEAGFTRGVPLRAALNDL